MRICCSKAPEFFLFPYSSDLFSSLELTGTDQPSGIKSRTRPDAQTNRHFSPLPRISRVSGVVTRSEYGYPALDLSVFLRLFWRVENQFSAVKSFGAAGCGSAFDLPKAMNGFEGVTGKPVFRGLSSEMLQE
jgi:hypothetical protein